MKRKVVKISSHKEMVKRLQGYGIFRITGPCIDTGERVTIHYHGRRELAEAYPLHCLDNNTTHIAKDYN